jgi:hemerythrin-like domain-containing protein
VEQEDLDQILEFIKTFADTCHHGKEEDILFVAMESAGIPRDSGPIGVMLKEHETGRSYVRNMSEAAGKYQAGGSVHRSQFVENAKKYTDLLTQHIDKEDNILYPMADMQLSEEMQRELIIQFNKLEQEKIGAGKHEELHELLHHLEETYLK